MSVHKTRRVHAAVNRPTRDELIEAGAALQREGSIHLDHPRATVIYDLYNEAKEAELGHWAPAVSLEEVTTWRHVAAQLAAEKAGLA